MCRIRSIIFFTATILLSLTIRNVDATIRNITMAIDTEASIYYDPVTNITFPIELADASRIPLDRIKYMSRGLPCSCSNLRCGCCTGINITIIKFNRLACTNITLVPEEFAIDFYVFMDDDVIMTNRLTARNPPAVCVPLYSLPIVSFCVRFFDLHYSDHKFHACVDFETRIGQWTIFILHFNCLTIGSHGVAWIAPLSNVDLDAALENVNESIPYDVVNFEIADDDSHYLHTSTATPEEEDHIGTLKL